jgi:hypothetical protein
MTRRDDRSPDMLSSTEIDAAIEQVLRGATVGDDAAPFARFVDDVRVMADRVPPRPSLELAGLLAGLAADRTASATAACLARRERCVRARSTRPRSGRSRTSEIRLRVAALGLAGKAAVSLALAATVAAGGVAGILPEPATHFVRRAIEVVTPFELPHHGAEHPGRNAHTKADAGVTPTNDEAPQPRPDPQPGATVRETAVIDLGSVDVQARAETDPRVGAPTADMSSWVRPHPKKSVSPAQGPKPAAPASTPPTREEPARGPPPHAGLPAKPKHGPPAKLEPGPQRDHDPPGRPPSGALHPDEPHDRGTRPKDQYQVDSSNPSGTHGPGAGLGSPAGRPPGHGGQGPHGGPPTNEASPCRPSRTADRIVPFVETMGLEPTTPCLQTSSTG